MNNFLFQGVDFNDQNVINEMKNIWDNLNYMAENDEENYKKFISSNIEKGKKLIEKENKKNEFTISVNNFTKLITFECTLKQFKKDSDLNINKKLLINNETINNNISNIKELNNEGKIYFNIIKSNIIDKPLNKDSKPIDINNINNWDKIPYVITTPEFKNDIDYTKIYYNIIINDKLSDIIFKQDNAYNKFIKYLLNIYEHTVFSNNNILFKYTTDSEYYFYVINKETLKLKNYYKGYIGKNMYPKPFILKIKSNNDDINNNKINKNDIIFKDKDDNNMNSLNIPNNNNIKNKPKIEIIQTKENSSTFNIIEDNNSSIIFEINLPTIKNIKEINLMVSKNIIKITSISDNIIIFQYINKQNYTFNKNNITAKFIKSKNILNLTITKLY